MTVNQLRCFAALAKELNYAKAARELYISQPAVTRQIRVLEEELGVQLFSRNSRSVRLTPAGQILYQDADDILSRIEQAARRTAQAAESSVLNIGCVTTLQVGRLPEIFRKFKAACPEAMINMADVPHFDFKRILADGNLDLIFIPKELAYRTPEFTYRHLLDEALYCIVPAGHPLAQRSSVCSADLAGETLIMLDNRNCPPKMGMVQQIMLKQCSEIIVNLSASALYTIPMVQGHLGIAVMPGMVIPYDIRDIRCVPFELQDPAEEEFGYGMVYPAGEISHTLRTFIRIAEREFEP